MIEWIPRPAALAFTMPQYAVDDAHMIDEGDNLHAGARGANAGINLENLLQRARRPLPSIVRRGQAEAQ